MLEYSLIHAIANGQAWLCGPEKLKRLAELVTKERKPGSRRNLRDSIGFTRCSRLRSPLGCGWFGNGGQRRASNI